MQIGLTLFSLGTWALAVFITSTDFFLCKIFKFGISPIINGNELYCHDLINSGAAYFLYLWQLMQYIVITTIVLTRGSINGIF